MNKEKLLKAFKIIVIILLVMAIGLVVLLRWKSDIILNRVLVSVQNELTDSLRYEEAHMDWFSYFPCTSIGIRGLTIGSGQDPLIQGGRLDIVLSIWPLLHGDMLINRLDVEGSQINLVFKNDHWSYDILRKSEKEDDGAFKTRIRELVIENSTIHYDDGKDMKWILGIEKGVFEGSYENEVLDVKMNVGSTVQEFHTGDYTLPGSLETQLNGQYVYNLQSGVQQFTDWTLEHDAVDLTAAGTIDRLDDHEEVDMHITWADADLEKLKTWFPAKWKDTFKAFSFDGSWEGEADIKGKSSTKYTPQILLSARLKNGGIRFLENNEEIKGLSVDVQYDSGENPQASFIKTHISKSALLGKSLEGDLYIRHLDHPEADVVLKGSLPAKLLNLLPDSGLRIKSGDLDIEMFRLDHFKMDHATLASFVDQAELAASTDQLDFQVGDEALEIKEGSIHLSGGQLAMAMDHFKWNLATFSELEGKISAAENTLDYDLKSTLCEGQIKTHGTVTHLEDKPLATGTWFVSGIEMKQLLESFSNFDQNFITSQNLSGKTDIWAESQVPFDASGNMITDKTTVKAAIYIHNGRLLDMKALEDFSDFIHLEDLRDIRFNELRNYMKIENGSVFLPVMFIQSTALNLSISGTHSFNQDILYHVKLNAGQVAASKLKKQETRKTYKPARKSGWINLYYVLFNKATDVKYRQDRDEVIRGFEESTTQKEALRNYLVDKFGYDVYWIEPNEWEDIPEYQ